MMEEGTEILFVFLMVNMAWVFFQAGTNGDAFYALQKMISVPIVPYISPMTMLFVMLSMTISFVKDFVDEYHPHIFMLSSKHRPAAILTASLLAAFIILFGVMDSSQFILYH